MKKKYIKHHNDGSVWAKGFMNGAKMDGNWVWFRKDGSKMRAGSFKLGKQVGEWITYASDGRVVKKTLMK